MKIKEHELNYVKWQNHAFHFYIASRLLCLNDHTAPAAFCAQQTIELMLKATLLFHDKSFKPEAFNHRFNKMINAMKNKVIGSSNLKIPEYFYWDKRYQSVSRYPSKGKGLLLPSNMLDDLDECFYNLLVLDFQMYIGQDTLHQSPVQDSIFISVISNFVCDTKISYIVVLRIRQI